MPTPEAQAWRADMDREVNRLRYQFLFLFIFLLAALVLITVWLTRADNDFAQLVHQLQQDRYQSCITRVGEISAYNSKIPGPPGTLPLFPIPNCPPKPEG